MLFICYPKCTTCQKAQTYLENIGIDFEIRDIKTNNPTKEELSKWIKEYNLEVNKLFNTSGLLYKEYKLKDKIPTMSLEEKIELLSSNGMLVKRPLLITGNDLIIGFKIDSYDKLKKHI